MKPINLDIVTPQVPQMLASPRHLWPLCRGGLYYDFDARIDERNLRLFLQTAFPDQLNEFKRKVGNITDLQYVLATFTMVNYHRFRYSLRVVDNMDHYSDWWYPAGVPIEIQKKIIIRDLDQGCVYLIHEHILRAIAAQFNPRAKEYKINFAAIDSENPKFTKTEPSQFRSLTDLTRLEKTKINNTYRNPSVMLPAHSADDVFNNGTATSLKFYANKKVSEHFTNSFFFAFFLSAFFVIYSICNEKSTRSYEFLKLMGAADIEILFGHFLAHFIVWLFPMTACVGWFWYFGSEKLLPINVVLIFTIFSLLYLVQLICCVFLFTAPFQKDSIVETIFIFFLLYGMYNHHHPTEDGVLGYVTLVQPLVMLQRLASVCENRLSLELNFEEDLYEIFTFYCSGAMTLLTLALISIGFSIALVILAIYVTQFEKLSAHKKPAIILKDVNKTYKKLLLFSRFQALKDFSFAIYEKQITVLLGHNGAGKTTTIEIITGLASKDKGSVSVNGIPVSSYSDDFKKVLGYCPQENIFYDKLTVYQNLKIAAVLKGVSLKSCGQKIQKLTTQLDLADKLYECASNLSGGMKRRLCIAIAIIGYNEVMVVDEPSSGLDPENRRKIWDILLELRKHKTILLTTHFMQEADVLGDRIAIMYAGRVRCAGSPLFLKRVFHLGYLLRLELSEQVIEADLMNFIHLHVPGALYENQQVNEHFIRLLEVQKENNSKATDLNLRIADLFDALEDAKIKQKFGIQNFGLTSTSLEDVFIKIGERCAQEEHKAASILIEDNESYPLLNFRRVTGGKLFLQQFLAIAVKKAKLTIKNIQFLQAALYPLTLPIAMTLVLSTTMTFSLAFLPRTIESFDVQSYLGPMDVIWMANSFDIRTDLFREENHDWLKRKFSFTVVPYRGHNVSDALRKETDRLEISGFFKRILFLVERKSDYEYLYFVNIYKKPFCTIGTLESFFRSVARQASDKFDFDIKLRFKHVKPQPVVHQLNHDEMVIKRLFLYVAFNGTAQILVSTFMTLMLSLPFTIFVELLHDEMNGGSLEMQKIAGLSKTMYWVANFLCDYAYTYIIFSLSVVSIFFSDELSVFSPHLGTIFVLLGFALMNCLYLTYFIVNLNFDKTITQTLIKFWLLLSGASFVGLDVGHHLVVYGLDSAIISNQMSTSMTKKRLPFAFFLMILSPVYNFIDPMLEFITRYLFMHCVEQSEDGECDHLLRREFDLKFNIMAYLASMSMLGWFIYLLNRYANQINQMTTRLKSKLGIFKKTASSLNKQQISIEHLLNIKDPNIEKERNTAQQLLASKDFKSNILVVHDLCKSYGSVKAVDHLSFFVPRRECFGLLGINGAGKSTLFKIIGGTHFANSGDIMLEGYTFERSPAEYFSRLGYCPQENTHTGLITVADNLAFFARINGIPRHRLHKVVQHLIEQCDLGEHAFKFAKDLSGGNKRKLSAAIALIGKKDLILLDEPTTGVDACARRQLWKTIEFFKKKLNTSFILTSHSMDEVEQLCSKISIMIAGQLKCLGTFSYLKARYSTGFTITIKIKELNNTEANVKLLKSQMATSFEYKAMFKEFYMNTMVYTILSMQFNWSFLFRTMEKIKSHLDLDDFLITETNLEQIFLAFSETEALFSSQK